MWKRTHFLTLLDVDVHTVRIALQDEGDTFEAKNRGTRTLTKLGCSDKLRRTGLYLLLPVDSSSHVQGYLEM